MVSIRIDPGAGATAPHADIAVWLDSTTGIGLNTWLNRDGTYHLSLLHLADEGPGRAAQAVDQRRKRPATGRVRLAVFVDVKDLERLRDRISEYLVLLEAEEGRQ